MKAAPLVGEAREFSHVGAGAGGKPTGRIFTRKAGEQLEKMVKMGTSPKEGGHADGGGEYSGENVVCADKGTPRRLS